MNENTTTSVGEYRQQILDHMLQAVDGEGRHRIDEREAKALVKELTDQELKDGMPWNTPEEVAEMLLDIGPID